MDRLKQCTDNLNRNGFESILLQSMPDAVEYILDYIDKLSPGIVAAGDSFTVKSSGLLDTLKCNDKFRYIDCLDKSYTFEQKMAVRRQALMADVFISGVNAITIDGEMVWLDMIGNRIAPIVFGPLHVFIIAGKNKIVADIDNAKKRVKEIAAPINAINHPHFKTPCQITKKCSNCRSDDRICNSWLIMEKCFPKKRIKVIIINEELGY